MRWNFAYFLLKAIINGIGVSRRVLSFPSLSSNLSLLELSIIFFVVFLVSFAFFKLDEINAKKMNYTINELAKERTDYVFIEINPSFVLSIKDNKVNNVSCLMMIV